jgi:hypothetical protein
LGDDPLKDRETAYYELGLLELGIADQALLKYSRTKPYSDSSDPEAPSSAEEIAALIDAATKSD